jgi:hypothetical protein
VTRMTPVVIVGAGPYGLTTAAHLAESGLPVRVFGGVMESWQSRMPAGMYLKSTPKASDLSAPRPGSGLADFCRAEGLDPIDEFHPIGVDVFVRYGQWYQRRLVPQAEPVRVARVERRPGGFRVLLEDGEEFDARAVVVASGLVGVAHVPSELLALSPKGPDPDGPLSHSSQHAGFDAFAGRRVAVVGAGQSALESAALLHEAGARVWVVARAPRVLWGTPPSPAHRSGLHRAAKPETPLGHGWSLKAACELPHYVRRLPVEVRLRLMRNILGPAGGWWLRDRVEGRVPIAAGRRVSRAEVVGDEVRLTLDSAAAAVTGSAALGVDTGSLTVDHVLAATGYRVNVSRFDWLSEDLRGAVRQVPGTGSPQLDPWCRSSVPGLFFTGLASAPTLGPLMRFVAGTAYTAPRVARAVAGA